VVNTDFLTATKTFNSKIYQHPYNYMFSVFSFYPLMSGRMDGLKKILVANRGVCACRIIKTCKKMGIDYVTVYTEDDYQSLHVTQSKEKYPLASYADIEEIIGLAKQTSCDAIHPGYGFQAENPAFPQKCREAGIQFVGPTAENMLLLMCKIAAKQVAKNVHVPTAPSSDVITNTQEALSLGDVIGYPIVLKSPNGGGGIGMQLCANREQVNCQ
jgi:biotin carboxylase